MGAVVLGAAVGSSIGYPGVGYRGLWALGTPRLGSRGLVVVGIASTGTVIAFGRVWASHTRRERRWVLAPMGDGSWDQLVALSTGTTTSVGYPSPILALHTHGDSVVSGIKHQDLRKPRGPPRALGEEGRGPHEDGDPRVPQDVLDAAALAEERVDNGGALGDQRGLAEEGDDGEDAVEALELGVGLGAEGDALAQLRQDGQVQDDGAGQQRVLRAPGDGEVRRGHATPQGHPCAPPHAPHTCCG